MTKLLTQASRQSGKALDSAEAEHLESTNWSNKPTEPTKSTKFLDKPILKLSLVFKIHPKNINTTSYSSVAQVMPRVWCLRVERSGRFRNTAQDRVTTMAKQWQENKNNGKLQIRTSKDNTYKYNTYKNTDGQWQPGILGGFRFGSTVVTFSGVGWLSWCPFTSASICMQAGQKSLVVLFELFLDI